MFILLPYPSHCPASGFASIKGHKPRLKDLQAWLLLEQGCLKNVLERALKGGLALALWQHWAPAARLRLPHVNLEMKVKLCLQ